MNGKKLTASVSVGTIGLASLVAAASLESLAAPVLGVIGVGGLYIAEKIAETDPAYYVKACEISNWIGRYIPIH